VRFGRRETSPALAVSEQPATRIKIEADWDRREFGPFGKAALRRWRASGRDVEDFRQWWWIGTEGPTAAAARPAGARLAAEEVDAMNAGYLDRRMNTRPRRRRT